jgi:hypothetical protein
LKTEALARALEERQADFRLDLVPGDHSDATWLALLPSALDFIAGPWGHGGGTTGDRPVEIR